MCNQCHSGKKTGDGFYTLQWFLGVGFKAAKKFVSDYLGLSNGKQPVDPAKDLDWRRWSSELAAFFLQAKTGVTEAAILTAGGRMARYQHHTVVAFPVIGESLDVTNPVGWVVLDVMAARCPYGTKTAILSTR